jgi:hypothetical protein
VSPATTKEPACCANTEGTKSPRRASEEGRNITTRQTRLKRRRQMNARLKERKRKRDTEWTPLRWLRGESKRRPCRPLKKIRRGGGCHDAKCQGMSARDKDWNGSAPCDSISHGASARTKFDPELRVRAPNACFAVIQFCASAHNPRITPNERQMPTRTRRSRSGHMPSHICAKVCHSPFFPDSTML